MAKDIQRSKEDILVINGSLTISSVWSEVVIERCSFVNVVWFDLYTVTNNVLISVNLIDILLLGNCCAFLQLTCSLIVCVTQIWLWSLLVYMLPSSINVWNLRFCVKEIMHFVLYKIHIEKNYPSITVSKTGARLCW